MSRSVEPVSRARGTLAASGITAGAMILLSVLVYLFTLVAAHVLGPEHFGGVSAFLGLLLVANVGALALQATAARRTATCDPEHVDEVAREAIVASWQTTGALTALLLVASPLVAHALHISMLAALMAPATIAPLTMGGGYAGVLQGTQRWGWLAATFISNGAGRLLMGGLGIALVPSVDGATVGLALGAVPTAIVGWWGCRFSAGRVPERRHGLISEVWANGQSLLAFFVLTNLDVIIARNQFSHFDSGIYAAGGVLAKMCLFLPQFVVVVAFTKMAKDHAANSEDRSWLQPLGFVSALGAVAVGGTALLPGLAVLVVGGSEYDPLTSSAWLFAVEGTLFALLQMIVYRQIARQAKVARYLWATAAVVAAIGLLAPVDINSLVITVIACTAVGSIPAALARARLTTPSSIGHLPPG